MAIGFWQIALIVVAILILFGAGKLPKVMGDLGKGMRSFKEGIKGEDDSKSDDDNKNKLDSNK